MKKTKFKCERCGFSTNYRSNWSDDSYIDKKELNLDRIIVVTESTESWSKTDTGFKRVVEIIGNIRRDQYGGCFSWYDRPPCPGRVWGNWRCDLHMR